MPEKNKTLLQIKKFDTKASNVHCRPHYAQKMDKKLHDEVNHLRSTKKLFEAKPRNEEAGHPTRTHRFQKKNAMSTMQRYASYKPSLSLLYVLS